MILADDVASPVSTCLPDADTFVNPVEIVVNHGSGVIASEEILIKSEEFSRPNADLGNTDVIASEILDNTDVIASEKTNIPVDLSKMSNADTESLDIVEPINSSSKIDLMGDTEPGSSSKLDTPADVLSEDPIV